MTAYSDRKDRRKAVDQEKARVWTRYIRAGIASKARWQEAAKDVMSYFNSVEHSDYFNGSLGATSGYMNLADKSLCVSVNRAALVRSVICPHLYQKAPKREVNAKRRDAVSIALAHLLEVLLNYTVRETSYTRSAYRQIDDSALRSIGFLRTGWDPIYRVYTSWWVSSERVVVDPAAVQIDDADATVKLENI